MGILGGYICKDCGYRAPYSELAEAHIESQEAKGLSFRDMVKSFTCPQCGSTAQSDVGQGVKRMKSSRDRDIRSCLLSRPAEIHLGWLGYVEEVCGTLQSLHLLGLLSELVDPVADLEQRVAL
jgi:predicted RNA-binding Zn-ribbon protein involved in translation (DUF1610 family)